MIAESLDSRKKTRPDGKIYYLLNHNFKGGNFAYPDGRVTWTPISGIARPTGVVGYTPIGTAFNFWKNAIWYSKGDMTYQPIGSANIELH